jgi:hypothetical protein
MDPADVNNESAESGEPIRYELVPVTPRMVETLGWPPKVKAKVDLGDPGLPTAPPLVLDVGEQQEVHLGEACLARPRRRPLAIFERGEQQRRHDVRIPSIPVAEIGVSVDMGHMKRRDEHAYLAR